jgi:hypothetical protein
MTLFFKKKQLNYKKNQIFFANMNFKGGVFINFNKKMKQPCPKWIDLQKKEKWLQKDCKHIKMC